MDKEQRGAAVDRVVFEYGVVSRRLDVLMGQVDEIAKIFPLMEDHFKSFPVDGPWGEGGLLEVLEKYLTWWGETAAAERRKGELGAWMKEHGVGPPIEAE